MRKIMMIPLCLLLMLSLMAGCRSGNTTPPVDDTPTPTTEPTPTDLQTSQDPHVASLQESMGENGCLLAVAYLGSADMQYPEFTAGVERSGYPEKMPFLLDVPEENTAFRAGMEMEYSPYISLRDGKLAGGEGIWDISDYDLAWEAGW